MSITRRQIVLGSAAALTLGLPPLARAQSTTLKISHQFPGGSLTEGDFRDRLCRRFAADVEKQTKGALKFEIYPNSSLMKTIPQFAALRKGALDLTLYPLSYAGGEVSETNIGLMPGLVTNYDQAYSWKNAEVGKMLAQVLADKGVIIVCWIWQAGGVACRAAPLVQPEDAKGMKVRGGSREMDMILK
jgi:TRAP-type transport system periplasmic protein